MAAIVLAGLGPILKAFGVWLVKQLAIMIGVLISSAAIKRLFAWVSMSWVFTRVGGKAVNWAVGKWFPGLLSLQQSYDGITGMGTAVTIGSFLDKVNYVAPVSETLQLFGVLAAMYAAAVSMRLASGLAKVTTGR